MKFYLTKGAQRAAEGAADTPSPKRRRETASKSAGAPRGETRAARGAASRPEPVAKKRGRGAIVAIGGEPRVDLLPPEVRAERKSARTVRRVWLGVVGVAAVMIIASAAATLLATSAKSSLASAQTNTSTLLAEQSKYQPLQSAQSDVALVEAAQSVGGSTEIDWNSYLAKVQSTLPSGVTITAIDLTSSSPLQPYAQASAPLQGTRVATLTFTATSSTLPSVPTWLDGLTTLPGYADASPGSVSYDDSSQLYTADVTMHIDEAAYSGRFAEKGK